MGFSHMLAGSIELGCTAMLSGSGFKRPVAASQIARAIMGTRPIIPRGTPSSESARESRRRPKPASAFIAAWARVEALSPENSKRLGKKGRKEDNPSQRNDSASRKEDPL